MGALSPAAPPAGAGRARHRGIPRILPRLAAVALLVTAAGWTWSWWHAAHEPRPAFPLGQDAGRLVAAARAARLPLDAGEALRRLDARLDFARRHAGQGIGDWMSWETIAGLHLARAELTGDYRDYAAAEAALDRAFAIAPPGSGPHLARAGFNLAVHRIAAIDADLEAVSRYRIADAAPAARLGLAGEAAFYRGRYAEALEDFRQAETGGRSLSGAIHLALYESRLGDEAMLGRDLDAAEGSIYGPDLQSRSFVERSRGQFALRRGDQSAARLHFAAAERLFPGLWPNLYYLAVTDALAGRTDAALAGFEALGARRRIPEAMDAAAILHRSRGESAAARDWAGRADAVWRERMRLFPEAAAAHRLDHLLAFGRPAEALAMARLAFAARPFGDSAVELAFALIDAGRPAEALAALEPPRQAGWRSGLLHLARARALAALGRGAEAAEEHRLAVAENPPLAGGELALFLAEH